MKKLMFLVLVFLTSGCVATDIVRSKAADAFDSGLAAAETMTCNDSSIGAIKRKYCATQAGCQRWIDYCFPNGSIKEVWDATIRTE